MALFVGWYPAFARAWAHSMQRAGERSAIQPLLDLMAGRSDEGINLLDIYKRLAAQGVQIDPERMLEGLAWQGVVRPVELGLCRLGRSAPA